MPTATRKRLGTHSLALELAAGTISPDQNLLAACTVAKAGVRAAGKEVMLDRAGKVTLDEALAVRAVPCFTDEKFLETLMTAAKVAGTKVKAREDHNDAIGARAGYFDAFAKTNDGRVVADFHLFESYRNREIVLETASRTPEEIGLSIDFIPDFEIVGDRALMRVRKLLAVDIVDEGAITPGGLFLSAGVDTEGKDQSGQLSLATEPATPPPMADPKKEDPVAPKEPSITDVMATLAALSQTVASLVAAKPAAATASVEESAALKAVREEVARLAGESKENSEKLAVVTADNLRLKRTATALGVRVLPNATERATLATGSAEDIEKLGTAPKTFDEIVAARVASEKCSRNAANQWAMRAHADEYRASLKARGIYDPAKATK